MIDDQRAFARRHRDVLAHLDMAEAAELESEEDEESDEDRADREQAAGRRGRRRGRPSASRRETENQAKPPPKTLEDGMSEEADAPSGELPDEAETADAEEAAEAWRPPASGANERRGPDYKAFTTKFDEMIDAEDLCDPEELDAPARLSRQAARRICRASSRASPTGCSAG